MVGTFCKKEEIHCKIQKNKECWFCNFRTEKKRIPEGDCTFFCRTFKLNIFLNRIFVDFQDRRQRRRDG